MFYAPVQDFFGRFFLDKFSTEGLPNPEKNLGIKYFSRLFVKMT